MRRTTVYLSNNLEAILDSLVAIRHDEHPGSRPSISAVVSDALLAYAMQRELERIRLHGPTANDKKNAKALAEVLKANGYIQDYEITDA